MKKRIKNILFVMYLLILFLVVEIKIYNYEMWSVNIQMVKLGRSEGFWNCNLIPFQTIKGYLFDSVSSRVSITNLLGNIIPFLPLGFFLANILDGKKKGICVFLISFFSILLFEMIQFFTCLGSFDVDDLLLNVIASMIGYAVSWFCLKLKLNYNLSSNEA